MPRTKQKIKQGSDKISLTTAWLEMNDTALREAIIADCLPRYPKNEPPKVIQREVMVKTVKL
jgi:hypothetical protein